MIESIVAKKFSGHLVKLRMVDVEQRTVNKDWHQQVIFSTETCHVTLPHGIGPDVQVVIIP